MWGLLVSLALFTSAVFAEVPQAKCPFDETFDECFKGFIIRTIPELALNGIPEAAIPPLDPFNVPNLRAKFNSEMIAGSLEIRNAIVKGIGGSVILKFRTNIHEFNQNNFLTTEVSVHLPKVSVEGNWKRADLTVMNTKVEESGKFALAVDNVVVNLLLQGHLNQHNQTYYYPQLSKLTVGKPDIENVKIDATNLVMGNPELSKSVLDMVNSFWRVLYDEIHPIVTQQTETLGKQFIDSYISQYLPLASIEVHKMIQKNTFGK